MAIHQIQIIFLRFGVLTSTFKMEVTHNLVTTLHSITFQKIIILFFHLILFDFWGTLWTWT